MMDATPSLDLQRVRISPLADSTPLQLFRCGSSEIDSWASKQAHKLSKIKRVKIFVAHDVDGQSVLGFYSLSLDSKDTRSLDKALRQFPHMPVVYITYIAVLRSIQRQKLGTTLLINALRRAYDVSQHIGFHGVALRSLNEDSARLYHRYGFRAIDNNHNPLMLLPIQALYDLINPGAPHNIPSRSD